MIFNSPLKQGGIYLVLSILVGIFANGVRTDSKAIPFKSPRIEMAADENLLSDPSSPTGIKSISTEQALSLFQAGVLFVDAREIEEYEEGHIFGAISSEDFMDLTFTIEEKQGKTVPIVTYCGGGECAKSEELAYGLLESGFNQVYIYLGGWTEWEEKGLKIEK